MAFHKYFHVVGIRTFPDIGDCMGSHQLEIHEVEQNLQIACVFSYLFRNIRLQSSCTLGIARISASRKIFKKPLTFEYLCFPIFFLTMGIHFSHVLRIVWIHKSLQIHEWERYGYSNVLSMNWEKIFPNFLKSPQPEDDMAFRRIFSCYENQDIPTHS